MYAPWGWVPCSSSKEESDDDQVVPTAPKRVKSPPRPQGRDNQVPGSPGAYSNLLTQRDLFGVVGTEPGDPSIAETVFNSAIQSLLQRENGDVVLRELGFEHLTRDLLAARGEAQSNAIRKEPIPTTSTPPEEEESEETDTFFAPMFPVVHRLISQPDVGGSGSGVAGHGSSSSELQEGPVAPTPPLIMEQVSEVEVAAEQEKAKDRYSVPDHLGRVLVNLERSKIDKEIFAPPQIAKIIKPHQISGVRFLYKTVVESTKKLKTGAGSGCILAQTTGLGKTLQIITFCDAFFKAGGKTVLIILPANTLQNWIEEFERFLPSPRFRGSQQVRNARPRKRKTTATSTGSNESQSQIKSPVSSSPEPILPVTPDLTYRDFSVFSINETTRKQEAKENTISKWFNEGGVLLIGYEMFRNLVIQKSTKSKKASQAAKDGVVTANNICEGKTISKMVEYLTNPGPDCVIADEGNRIKNNDSGISQALKAIKTRRRIILTGYSLQTNLTEYWCMVDFVQPGLLGTKEEFSNLFEHPIQNGQCVTSTNEHKLLMKYRSYVLHSLVSDYVLRRSLLILKDYLPPKEEWVFLVKLTPLQRGLYRAFVEYLEALRHAFKFINPWEIFAVCSKIWNHPDLLCNVVQDGQDLKQDLEIERVKKLGSRTLSLDWAKPLLNYHASGNKHGGAKFVLLSHLVNAVNPTPDKLLVFSQSVRTLDLIERTVMKRPTRTSDINYVRLDASTTPAQRQNLVDDFNTSETHRVFLISSRDLLSLDLHLIRANRVVIFDANVDPSHDIPAICKVYRFGQTKKCHIYRFVAYDTLEMRVFRGEPFKRACSLNEFERDGRELEREYQCVVNPDKFEDPVMKSALTEVRDELYKEPFEYETRLIDDDQHERLSESEKQLATDDYETAKKSFYVK